MLPKSLLYIFYVMICINLYDFTNERATEVQNEYSGIILNNQHVPISFAHLYLKDSETGTVTDFNGEFIIPASWPGNGTIIISSIGYINKSIPVDELRKRSRSNKPVILTTQDYDLGELSVSADRLRSGTVRNYGLLSRMLGFDAKAGGFAVPESRVAYSFAQRVDIDIEPPYWLTSITIWADLYENRAFLNPGNREYDESDFTDEVLVRFSLIDKTEDGSPGTQSYLPEPIYILLDGSGARQEIDLSDYNLFMKNSDFFIVAEFIVDDPEFYYGLMPMFTAGDRGDGTYYRRSPFRKWEKRPIVREHQLKFKAEYLY